MKARLPKGYGRPDPQAMMRQVQKMQDEIRAKLEDLIAAAVNSAVAAVDKDSDEEMAKMTGGMNIPGLG